MKHELKTHPEHFQAAWVHEKPFEIRNNDRNFKVCDEIVLQEWDPMTAGTSEEEEGYTGREIHGVISYVTNFSQKRGWVVFGYHPTLLSE